MTCPDCEEPAKFQRYRDKTITTLLGEIRCDRAYYHGCGCQGGQYPMDQELGLQGTVTPGAAEVICLQGNLESFEEVAHKTLPKTCGLIVSPATVRRTTEGVGEDLAERQQQGETFGPDEDWEWHKDASGQKCAYVSLDATGVAQQAADGGKAPARMAWVGEVFNPTPHHEQDVAPSRKPRRIAEARYHAGLMSLNEMGKQLRRTAEAVGIEQADVVIGLTDGGSGLEQCLMDHVFAGLDGRVEFILDFYHAARHIHEFCESLHARNEAAASEQAQQWCSLLKREGGLTLLSRLEELDLEGRPPTVREEHRQLCGYLRNNLHRTEYPRYQAHGWQIGSGTIESACKNVINRRLDGSGMRWSEHGTNELCHVRALFKSQSGVWEDYWSRAPDRQAA